VTAIHSVRHGLEPGDLIRTIPQVATPRGGVGWLRAPSIPLRSKEGWPRSGRGG